MHQAAVVGSWGSSCTLQEDEEDEEEEDGAAAERPKVKSPYRLPDARWGASECLLLLFFRVPDGFRAMGHFVYFEGWFSAALEFLMVPDGSSSWDFETRG